MLTEQEYNDYRSVLAKHDTVNFMHWCIMTGDEEEIQIVDMYGDDRDKFLSEMPEEIRDQVDSLVKVMSDVYNAECGDWDAFHKACDQLGDLIKPHIDLKEMWDQDQRLWDNLQCCDTWEQFHENDVEEDQGKTEKVLWDMPMGDRQRMYVAKINAWVFDVRGPGQQRASQITCQHVAPYGSWEAYHGSSLVASGEGPDSLKDYIANSDARINAALDRKRD